MGGGKITEWREVAEEWGGLKCQTISREEFVERYTHTHAHTGSGSVCVRLKVVYQRVCTESY